VNPDLWIDRLRWLIAGAAMVGGAWALAHAAAIAAAPKLLRAQNRLMRQKLDDEGRLLPRWSWFDALKLWLAGVCIAYLRAFGR